MKVCRQHEVLMVSRVPCPHPGCSGGEIATGHVEADTGMPVTRTCHLCEGSGEVPPLLLDPVFLPGERA